MLAGGRPAGHFAPGLLDTTVEMESTSQGPLERTLPHMNHPTTTSSPTSETVHASSDESSPRPQAPYYDRPLPPLPPKDDIRLVIASSASLQQAIRRKPLSKTASPIAIRYSSGLYLGALREAYKPEHERSFSLDSPYQYTPPTAARTTATSLSNRAATSETYTESSPDEFVPSMHADPDPDVRAADLEVKHPNSEHHNPATLQTLPAGPLQQPAQRPRSDEPLVEASADEDDSLSVLDGYDTGSSHNSSPISPKMSPLATRKPAPPHLNLGQRDSASSQTTNRELSTPNTDKPLPQSPDSSRRGLLGWDTTSPSATDVSGKGFSPLTISPYGSSRIRYYTDASPVTTIPTSYNPEAPKSQSGLGISTEPGESDFATSTTGASSPADEIAEMEDELRAISAELASSIRREMDLEDLVDRLQVDRETPASTANKRTSDYFSDAGYGSAKFGEYDQAREEIERIQRKSEQEKAQVTLELTNKLQEERTKRQELDGQIKTLSEKASAVDLDQATSDDASSRVKELEDTCETLRRKLSEERQAKDNFEDLFSALKGELQDASSERDNLRDEIVPQLRARVEGLESSAAELEKMAYESTKMQQELQTLKVENSSLRQSKPRASIGSIAEEPSAPPPNRASMARPSSIMGPLAFKRPPSLTGLSRSRSVKSTESREQLSDRIKDVEEQRDALHRALKALLERQELQNKESEKKIKSLEMERDRLFASSPAKAGFSKDVSNLREEVNVLRRRAEEALEQKWQVEKGLAGLKTDLDRAEQEITSLKSLLGEKDILIPASTRRSGMSDSFGGPVSSDSLLMAHQDLQKAYAEALERIRKLELGASPEDERTIMAIEKLERALASAVADRDLARSEAATYQSQLDTLRAGEKTYLESEKALADELVESARRVEELSLQVRQQLATNQTLRERLVEAVARGEAGQKAHVERIAAMQNRLYAMEQELVAAQTASEERMTRHEEEVSALKETQGQQLARLSTGLLSPRLSSPRLSPRTASGQNQLAPPKSPRSPFLTSPRSPRFSSSREGPAMSVSDETQVATLKERVAELEKTLVTADFEMQEVVSRMQTAQIEVLQLQEEREAAVSQTRKLERELQAEKVKAFEEKFKALQG